MRQIYIDIDIAKNLHYASIVDSYGEVLEKAFSFENNIEGFEILLPKGQEYDLENCIFGMESTAHYSNNLSNYLLTHHYNIDVINTLQTFSLGKTQM